MREAWDGYVDRKSEPINNMRYGQKSLGRTLSSLIRHAVIRTQMVNVQLGQRLDVTVQSQVRFLVRFFHTSLRNRRHQRLLRHLYLMGPLTATKSSD